MVNNSCGDAVRDDFICSYGRFRTKNNTERLEPATLREMFLPNLSPEGRRILARDGSRFVQSQLLHYGVKVDIGNIPGNGTLLMKKMLREGACDRVPDHIVSLREEMHAEWLDSLGPEQVASHPEFAMDKYFLTAGRPDRTKTRDPVGVPLDPHSTYRAGNMVTAARRVEGLHIATGYGPQTQTIFMGWDKEAVQQAASNHAGLEAKEMGEKRRKRTNDRNQLYARYLDSIRGRRGPGSASPVGKYIVDCNKIENGWDDVGDLSLRVMETRTEGIYQADFDFGIIEGVMLLCADEKELDAHIARAESEDESDESDEDSNESISDEDNDESELDQSSRGMGQEPGTRGKKRASNSLPAGGKQPKRAKGSGARPLEYFIRLRFSDTGTGQIYPDPDKGTLRFKDEKLAAFSAKADMSCVDDNVCFNARKVSGQVSSGHRSWSNYSDDAYEYARVNRWR